MDYNHFSDIPFCFCVTANYTNNNRAAGSLYTIVDEGVGRTASGEEEEGEGELNLRFFLPFELDFEYEYLAEYIACSRPCI